MLIRRYGKDSRLWTIFTPAGMVSISLSIVLARFGGSLPAIDFIEGLLLGLGITLSVAGMIFGGRELKRRKTD